MTLYDPSYHYDGAGVKTEFTQDIGERVIQHRNRFAKLFEARYRELLPTLITYSQPTDIAIDWIAVEIALRRGYHVAIGDTPAGKLQVLGVVNRHKYHGEHVNHLFQRNRRTEKDINFCVKPEYRFKHYIEITPDDDYQSGNFVVLKNKPVNYISDYEIIHHYTVELAEIVNSRFSLSMQTKMLTFFIDEVGSETANQVANKLYNGVPYIKASKLFDPIEQIHQLNNDGLANNFVELKREYQNKLSELNNMLGINSLAVEKASGVSDIEAKGNQSFTTSNANIYLGSRNVVLLGLNRRFNTDIKAVYNDQVKSELAMLEGEDLIKADPGKSDDLPLKDGED